MNAKEFLKPNILKILIFLFIGVFYLYFAKEDVCAVSLFFTFCYNAYGFPFLYAVTGDINTAFGYIKTLFLGEYFTKYGNFLFNFGAFALDLIFVYLLACFVSMLFKNMKLNINLKFKK